MDGLSLWVVVLNSEELTLVPMVMAGVVGW